MRYVVVTGYCENTEIALAKREFLSTWSVNTRRYSSPIDIFTISPFPNPSDYLSGQWIDCHNNLGHVGHLLSGQKNNKLCGWTVSTLIGALLAYHADADMIFKEQDCLAFGDWVGAMYDQCEAEKRQMVFGRSSFMEVEQSLFLIKKDFLLDYVRIMLSFPQSDKEWLPEYKFKMLMQEVPNGAGFLNFGYGRDRPINFDDKLFYAQQLTEVEMRELEDRKLI